MSNSSDVTCFVQNTNISNNSYNELKHCLNNLTFELNYRKSIDDCLNDCIYIKLLWQAANHNWTFFILMDFKIIIIINDKCVHIIRGQKQVGTKKGRDQNRRGPKEEGTYWGGDQQRRGPDQGRPIEGGPLVRGPKEGGPEAWQPRMDFPLRFSAFWWDFHTQTYHLVQS